MPKTTLRSVPEGEKDTIRLLRKRKIFIDWKKRWLLEKAMRVKVRGVFRRMWKLVAERQIRSVFTEAEDPMIALRIELEALTYQYALKAFELGASDAALRINKIAGFGFTKDPAIEWLQVRAREFAEKFTTMSAETVQRTVFVTVQKGIQEGWTIRQIQDEMKRQYGIALRRGEVIARTTVIKAHNQGSMLQSQEMGMTEMELVGCDPECEECQAIIAQNPWPVDEAMAIEDDLHPNHTGSWVATQRSVDEALNTIGMLA